MYYSYKGLGLRKYEIEIQNYKVRQIMYIHINLY